MRKLLIEVLKTLLGARNKKVIVEAILQKQNYKLTLNSKRDTSIVAYLMIIECIDS